MPNAKRQSISVYDADDVPVGDEEARRISNAIDENIRVRIFQSSRIDCC